MESFQSEKGDRSSPQNFLSWLLDLIDRFQSLKTAIG
jgi:hypothetical protein